MFGSVLQILLALSALFYALLSDRKWFLSKVKAPTKVKRSRRLCQDGNINLWSNLC